jgi:hypothetical protein
LRYLVAIPITIPSSMMRDVSVSVRVCESEKAISREEKNYEKGMTKQEIITEHVCVWFHCDEFDNLFLGFGSLYTKMLKSRALIMCLWLQKLFVARQ